MGQLDTVERGMWIQVPLQGYANVELHHLLDRDLRQAGLVRRIGGIIEAEIQWDDGVYGKDGYQIESRDGPFESIDHAKRLVEETLQLAPMN
jgi:hypothetical protein